MEDQPSHFPVINGETIQVPEHPEVNSSGRWTGWCTCTTATVTEVFPGLGYSADHDSPKCHKFFLIHDKNV